MKHVLSALFALAILSCSDSVAAPASAPSSTSTCRMGEARCAKACDAGDLRSCYFFGRMLSDGNGVAKSAQRAYELFRATCEKGLGDACNAEAVTIRDGLLDGSREYEKSLPGFEKGCGLNSTKGCNNAAKIHQDLKDDAKRAAELFEKSCLLRGDTSATGCIEGGRLYSDGGTGLVADKTRAGVLFTKGCEMGSSMACTSGKALGLPLRFDQNVDRAHDERFCAEGEVKACASLGSTLMHGKGIGVDLKGARDPLRAACIGGEKYGCRDLAKLLLQLEPAPTAAETAEGVEAEKRACELGMAVSCKRLGDLHLVGLVVPRSVDAAVAAYQRACMLPTKGNDTPLGCQEAGAIARQQGKEGALVAELVFQDGCARGDKDSCRGLQSMGKSTAGFEKNVDRHEALRSSIERCEKKGDNDACGAAGFALLTTGTPEQRAQSAKYFELACDGGRAAGCRQLAVSYNTGKGGVARDPARAAELFARACAMGEREVCPVVAKVTNEAGAATRAKVTPILDAACRQQVTEACEAAESLKIRP